MKRQHLLKITRRRFLKITGAISASFMFLNPLRLLADTSSGVIERNDLEITPDIQSATGFSGELLDFAQVSDVHIVDEGHPLRFEELQVAGVAPAIFAQGDPYIESISRD